MHHHNRIVILAVFTLIAVSVHTGESSEADLAWSKITENTMSWTLGPALALPEIIEPGAQHIAYKDPSVVRAKDQWHIFASRVRHQQGATRYALAYFRFPDWKDAAKAEVVPLLTQEELTCAPHVFYFRPRDTWYLFYVWQNPLTHKGGPAFSSLQDIDRPETLTPPRACFPTKPAFSLKKGFWLDFHVIADATHAYLFFTNDAGNFLYCRTTLDAFPLGWSDPVVALEAPTSVIFEGSITYALTDRPGYVTFIEAIGPKSQRFYNAWTAETLDGVWKPTGSNFDNPFAGPANAKPASSILPWSIHVSHGELLRAGNDERMQLDPAHLQFLIQGWDGTTRVPGIPLGKFNGYHEVPWRLGVLTANP